MLGPIGPVDPRPQVRPLRRALAVALAAGFAGVGFYYLRRWRRRRHIADAPVTGRLETLPNLSTDSDEDFYAALFGTARRAIADCSDCPPAQLTLRRLAELRPGDLDADAERWRDLCRRAESVLYAGCHVSADERAADLALLQRVLAAIEADGDQDRGA